MAGTTFTWTATTQSAWTTPSNWSPIGTPAAADTAVVPAGSILVNSGTVAATDVGIGGSLTAPQPSKGTIAVTTGAEILVSDALAVWSGSTLSVDSASSVDIGTSGSRVAGDVVIDNGHSLVGDGLVQASVLNNGTIEVLGTVASNVFTAGTLEITGSVAGAGTVDFSGVSSVVRFDGTVSPSQTIDFGTGSELILNAPGVSFGAPITNLNTGDKIEFNFGPGVTISNVAVNAGTVTVTTTTSSYQLTNVSFAAGANQTFFFNTDASNGDPFIFVAPPFANWVGSVSTDYATPGNWQSGAIPNATESVSFSGNPGTISGTGNALSLNIGGPTTQNWTFSGATITVAGQPSPPFLPYGIGFNANTVLTNATTLNVAGGTTNIGNPTGVTVTAQSSSHITTEGDSVGGTGQSGSLVLTGAGTTWTEQSGPTVNGSIPGFLNVGFGGSSLGSVTVTSGATLNTDGSATFGGTTGSQGSGTISAAGVWNANNIDIGGSGAGTLVINASTVSTGATFNAVGVNAGSTGSLQIINAGTYQSVLAPQTGVAFNIGINGAAGTLAAASGSVLVSGTHSLLNLNGNPLAIGNNGGTGSLSIAAGGTVEAGTPDSNQASALQAGRVAGGTGSITVSDANSLLDLSGFVLLGQAGTGNLLVENSGSVAINNAPTNGAAFFIGSGFTGGTPNVGGSGHATIMSNGQLTAAESINIGGNGADGTLSVNSGTVSAATGFFLANAATVAGTLFGGAGFLDIGAGGVAKETEAPQTNGFAVEVGASNGSLTGPTTLSNGTLDVSGTGALLDTNGNGLEIGRFGNGTLTVSQSASVVAGTPDSSLLAATAIGRLGNGSLTVSDPGSTYTANGFMYVGRGGTGSLTIQNHGTVIVGLDSKGSGSISFGAGQGSGTSIQTGGTGIGLITSGGDLFSQQSILVGSYGARGTLTINGGATAEAAARVAIGNTATFAAGTTIATTTGTTIAIGTTVLAGDGTIDVGASGLLKADGTGVAAGQPSLLVGDGVGSTGTLIVSGTSAMVDSTGDLSAGQNQGGTGDVSTGSGGQIEVTGNLIVWQGSTVSVLDSTSGIDVGTSLAPQTGDILVEPGHQLYGDGLASSAVVNDGTVIATNNGTFSASIGGTLALTGAISGTGTAELASGSTLTLNGTLGTGQTVVFDSGAAETLILNLPGTHLSNALDNVATGDRIELGNSISITAVNIVNSNTAEVLYTGGTYDITNITFAPGTDNFTFGHDAFTGNDFFQAICFCAGTAIATPDGHVPVERLAVGDSVLTASGAVRDIVWIGTGKVLATRGRRTAATPVIVRKGALADNVPHRDLHVTKGHALYIDGVLIPVEFLVNHRTILWDDRAQEVTIYHVELATHDVLIANGAPAESYRDDGNRWLFQNDNPGWTLPPQAPCAPVLTGGPIVDDMWRRILDRAGPRKGAPLTDDPDLHLLVDGRRIDPTERGAERYAFRLAARPRSVRIRSRAAVPQELGVAAMPAASAWRCGGSCSRSRGGDRRSRRTHRLWPTAGTPTSPTTAPAGPTAMRQSPPSCSPG